MLVGAWAGAGGLGRPLGQPPTMEPAEGEEEPTEGVKESTECEGGSTAAVALRGRLERPLRWPPAGEPTEGVEEPAATTLMEAIVQPGGGWHVEAVSTYQSPSFQVHHEVEGFQEVGPQYGESHSCLQKTPPELLATGGEGLPAAAPAQNRCVVSCHDGWPRSCCCRLVRDD